MEYVDSDIEDWNAKVFIGFINTFLATDPTSQGKLIVRRNRDIGKGTGTLLSPTDRKIGDNYANEVVLTMYKITGNVDKGWDGSQIWIPNIKLPGDCIYYTGEMAYTKKIKEYQLSESSSLSMVAEPTIPYGITKKDK